MTSQELQELRDWSVKLLRLTVINPDAPRWLQRYSNGRLVDYWHPDKPNGQIEQVIDRMVELGWFLELVLAAPRKEMWKDGLPDSYYNYAKFYRYDEQTEMEPAIDSNRRIAILKVAKEVVPSAGLLC